MAIEFDWGEGDRPSVEDRLDWEEGKPRKRFPVLRTGERDPIDPYKRRLIYRRDGYSCGWCGHHVEPDSVAPGRTLELDHIIPWSALGSDRSDNLRTLCTQCNDDRSNFVDEYAPRPVGVTHACYWCARRGKFLSDYWVGAPVDELDQIRVYCGCCDLTSWVPHENWIL